MATSLDQTDFIKTALRMPRKLHARVQESAEANRASLNTEILQLIQKALDAQTVELGEKSLDAIRSIVRDEKAPK